MDEMNTALPPKFEETLNEIYKAPLPDAAFSRHLEAQLHQRYLSLIPPRQETRAPISNERSFAMRILRTQPVLAIIAVILALLLLTGIAYAYARITGFIPGIGFTKDVQSVLATPVVIQRPIILSPTGAKATSQNSQTPTPVLAGTAVEPVKGSNSVSVQKRQGITITVEQVVAEADRLVIAYKTTGLPPNLFGLERAQAMSGGQKEEPVPEQVRLPDGTLLKFIGGGGCEGSGDLATSWLSCRLDFSPLPAGVNNFTLEIRRLQNALPGELPEDWRIPIQLTPVSSVHAESGVQDPNLRSLTIDGITLQLLKTSQSSTLTAFQLGLEWQGENRMLHHTAPITLQDDKGRYYVLSGGPDNGSSSIDKPNFSTLPSSVTSAVQGDKALTFGLDWVVMSANSPAILTFDLGKNPRLGQEWLMDTKVNAGGFDVHFTRARLKAAADGQGSVLLEFDIHAPDEVTEIDLSTNDGPPNGESGYDKSRGVLVSRISLPALPDQAVTVNIFQILYKVVGPWKITWQPQPVDPSTVPTVTPAPTRLANPAATLAPAAPLLSELEALLKRGETANPRGPGWVHQVIEQNLAEDAGALDAGDAPQQPRQSRIESWYFLDEQGYAQTTLHIHKSLDGKFLSADINQGVYHFSIPEGLGGIDQKIYLTKPQYDFDLLSVMNGYIANHGSIRQESIAVDGVSCTTYEASQVFDPAQVISGEHAPVQGMRYAACVDPQTGKLIQIQISMTYTDGSSRVKETTRFVALEKVERLPDEVNQLLEKIILPG